MFWTNVLCHVFNTAILTQPRTSIYKIKPVSAIVRSCNRINFPDYADYFVTAPEDMTGREIACEGKETQ